MSYHMLNFHTQEGWMTRFTQKKSIYGSGFLCSNRIAQLIKTEKEYAYITDIENKKAECIEKEKQTIRFSLSEREKELIESLSDE